MSPPIGDFSIAYNATLQLCAILLNAKDWRAEGIGRAIVIVAP
jgi:hypothetical protein